MSSFVLSRQPLRRLLTLGVLVALVLAAGAGLASDALAALPVTSTPELSLDHLLVTTPFVGSAVSVKDDEGSAYVARDNSLWLVDDDGRMIYEVNPDTGALKRTITRSQLAATTIFSGTATAGTDRNRDLESLAYDRATDTLYAFSGSCCTSTVLPTVFRLTRRNGSLQLDSYQPLPTGSDFTAADWNPADHKLYVGISKTIRTYNYATNAVGSTFQVSGLTGIQGFDFSADGSDLFVARSPAQLSRVDWATKTLVPGWTFDLTKFGMLDARAAALINDRFYVSDGYDHRAAGDPKSHAVFVFNVSGGASPGPAPIASFTANPTSGQAPLAVSFTDTSTGSPTAWSWSFGDGQSSTAQNPTHTFTDPGTYNVRLTASNAGGSTSATRQITVGSVTPPPSGQNLVPNPGFETNLAGWDTNNAAAVALERVAGGHSGSWAARLTNTGTTTVTETLNDNPNVVASTAAGTYSGSVWVRADAPGAKLYLRLREYSGSTKLSEKVVGVTLSTSWQQVSATLVPTAPGSSLELATAVYSAAPGTSYYADDVALSLN
ncbi:PKD domain-containing protein [Nocardioides iriomotensis]|uniref:PKD domain-containing protein n=1 Tax=Nocardioides iriomotensis TaxID=715784 RepID=A0A4V1Z1A2_9ACTN|nr:PKD domain-containing protein [Nocardioides iriomotensis]RYU10196.1 PKD domain-containing protein [Nocardioides iriomotensis]